MNRRDFLQKTGVAAIAVAALPKAIRKADNYSTIYKTALVSGTPTSEKEMYY